VSCHSPGLTRACVFVCLVPYRSRGAIALIGKARGQVIRQPLWEDLEISEGLTKGHSSWPLPFWTKF
jgi:hypothetical protein